MGERRKHGVSRQLSGLDLYHVVSRGTGRQLIYEDDEDRKLFLKLLDVARKRFHVEIYAYCLMGNHFHLLLHAPLDHIARFMKYVCGTYAQRFNERAGRTGHLFQERYRSEPIEDEEYLLTVVHYIHLNPARANLGEADEYPWSSYHEYLCEPRICSTMFVLDLLGGPKGFVSLLSDETRSGECIDIDAVRGNRPTMSDEDAIAHAESVLDGVTVDAVKSLSKEIRDTALRNLKASGLTIRQIERLTGIGRSVVMRA